MEQTEVLDLMENQGRVDRRAGKVEFVDVLGQRQLGDRALGI